MIWNQSAGSMVYRGFPGVMEFCVVELDLFLVNVFLVEKTEFLVVGILFWWT